MARKSDELDNFVHASLARGLPRAEIAGAMQAAGWDRTRIDAALAAYAEVDFPVPVPRPAPFISAREAFYYVVLFAALATFAAALGTLLFTIIDKLLPDPTDGAYAVQNHDSVIRWSIAHIVVALPLFGFMSRRTDHAMRVGRFDPASPIRLWLSYAAILIAVPVLVTDAIVLIGFLLTSEATLRFLLKIATVAVIAIAVLAYYLRSLRTAEQGK